MNPVRSVSHIKLVALFISALLTSSAIALEGRVVGVSDGDTITLLDASRTQHKIRLAGIDAPESGQAFGNRAKQALSDCVFGQTATTEGSKIDKYGRTVAKVIVGGVDCNLRQIELGFAWHYKKYENEQAPLDRRAYASAEKVARAARAGLWVDPRPTSPWDWRNGDTVGTQRGDALAKETTGQCDCNAGLTCIGKRGGIYCLTSDGTKRYVRP
ncbi:MAG: thermonuclease family protein [Betaproteobacteria bacterium]|nr:MAG: thermonuclease family protein [Betaproteobacteria bacterium]